MRAAGRRAQEGCPKEGESITEQSTQHGPVVKRERKKGAGTGVESQSTTREMESKLLGYSYYVRIQVRSMVL